MTEGIIQSEAKAETQPRVLFKPGSWLATIDFINHLILFNNVLVTVLSEKEGGKTSFATLLQNNLDQQIKSASIVIKPPYHKENLIKDIAAQLALNHDENTDLISIVKQINEQKSHVLLLIDDAQYLPDTLIQETLFAIKSQESYSFFHLCFLSDYSIVASLNHLRSSLGDSFIHTIELGALNENEARTYVLQRAMASQLISKPLSDAQITQFYQLTKGNLAKINNDLESFVNQCTPPMKKDMLKRVKTAGIVAGTVLVAGFLGFYLSQAFHSPPSQDNIATPAHSEEIQTIAMKLPELPEKLESYIASWQDSSTRQLVYSSLPTKDVFEEPDDEIPNDTKPIVDKVVVIPKLPAKNLIVEKHQLPAKSVSKTKPKKTPSKKQIKLAKASVKKSNHKSTANLYTIQLTASHDKKHIEHFRKTNKLLAQNAKLRRITNAKGVWYVLTLGEYQNKVQAQHRVSKLPTNLAKLHPWVRPVSSFG
ncbi:SPOR domain-containing protein [Legionella sainthelensi]|uniref:SPOR domain-containing protein n=1 Tax=Legionella sainthelensi TaxID=28087 RepID=UPI000E2039D7|nr:SPOR domain-containing protein [Legionella sainthelensi]